MNSREQSLGLRGQRGWRPGGRAGAVARGLPLTEPSNQLAARGQGRGLHPGVEGGICRWTVPCPTTRWPWFGAGRSPTKRSLTASCSAPFAAGRGGTSHVPRPTSQRGLCHLGCRLQMPAVQPAPRAVMGHTPLGPLPPRSPSGATGLTHAPCLSPHTGAPGFLMAGTTSSDQLTTD